MTSQHWPTMPPRQAGECATNPKFMMASCAEACKAAKGAQDKDPNCAAWAAADECKTNPGFMKKTCPQSCRAAPAAQEKRDTHSECGSWAAKGECEKARAPARTAPASVPYGAAATSAFASPQS
eukprot:1279145-Prymnesium_polylepis.2